MISNCQARVLVHLKSQSHNSKKDQSWHYNLRYTTHPQLFNINIKIKGPKVPGSHGPKRYLKVTLKYELDSKEGSSCILLQFTTQNFVFVLIVALFELLSRHWELTWWGFPNCHCLFLDLNDLKDIIHNVPFKHCLSLLIQLQYLLMKLEFCLTAPLNNYTITLKKKYFTQLKILRKTFDC